MQTNASVLTAGPGGPGGPVSPCRDTERRCQHTLSGVGKDVWVTSMLLSPVLHSISLKITSIPSKMSIFM